MTYDIFGKPYSINDEGKITKLKKSLVRNTRMYTGREYDRGLKLYYNRARYYDPKLARFISRDPIDIADDVNLYAYVGNNSVMFVDLMGTEKVLIITGLDYEMAGIPLGTAGGIYKSMEVQKQYYIDQGFKLENITTKNHISNIDELNKAISSGNYTNIAIVAHSNNQAIVLNPVKGEGVINSANTLSLSKNLGNIETLTIVGCMSGYGGNSIAKIIADDFDINVRAPNADIIPSIEDDKFYYGGVTHSTNNFVNKVYEFGESFFNMTIKQESTFLNF